MYGREYGFRFYRDWMDEGSLTRTRLVQGESDLLIFCRGGLGKVACRLLSEARGQVLEAISDIDGFGDSLRPVGPSGDGRTVVDAMLRGSTAWDVGPMAAVAGAVAHHVARGLREHSDTVIVENGGDVYAFSPEPVTFRVYPGEDSPFPGGFGFSVSAPAGVAVCTSSGRVGHSWSAGRADAVVAVAADGADSDAAATAIANTVFLESDVDRAVAAAREGGLEALVVMAGSRMGVLGCLEITGLKGA